MLNSELAPHIRNSDGVHQKNSTVKFFSMWLSNFRDDINVFSTEGKKSLKMPKG